MVEGHTTTGSGAVFKFPEFLGSTTCCVIYTCHAHFHLFGWPLCIVQRLQLLTWRL